MFYIRWLQTSKATLNPEPPPASLPFFLLFLQALLSLRPANCFGATSDCRTIKNQGTCGRWYHLCLGNTLMGRICSPVVEERRRGHLRRIPSGLSRQPRPPQRAAGRELIPCCPPALRNATGVPACSPSSGPLFITCKEN